MTGITRKNVINNNGKTKSARIFTKNATHLIIVPIKMRRKTMTTTNPNLPKKENILLKPSQGYEKGQEDVQKYTYQDRISEGGRIWPIRLRW